jgi:fatty-acyl-CoA synthase
LTQASYTKGPDTPEIVNTTLGDLLKEAATEVPDRTAMIFGHAEIDQRQQWTYAEMYHDAVRVAQAIATHFKPGERVAIWSQNTPQWILVEFGAAMAGVILVTVNPSYQGEELTYVLKQSKSAGIFVSPEYRGNKMMGTVLRVQGECPALRKIVSFAAWEQFLDSADENVELPALHATDPCMIQYTSGTTGFPKGALLHHRGLVNNGYHTMNRAQVSAGDVLLTMMPLFHTGGCVLCVLGAVSHRATQVIVETFEPGLVLDLIDNYKVNSWNSVPTMLVSLLEHHNFTERDTSSVHSLISGGSIVPAALVNKFEETLGATFTIVFGQTECSPVASMVRADDLAIDKATTIGGPMPHVEIKIVDPDTGQTLPTGTKGEYCTRGYHVMHEYFEMPEATAETIDQDGWLHTGDICSMDERGYCKVEGRLKDMIIRGGENIYPREIEALLFQHPTVGEVAVVGLPDERLGEVVGAFIRSAPGETPDQEELFAYLREHASPQKTPKHWFLMDEFPLTGSGKIQKYVLREQWLDGKILEMRERPGIPQ